MALCSLLPSSKFSLRIKGNLHCRYHRTDAESSIGSLTNESMCPEAYHSLYPKAFSMFYATFTEKDGDELEYCCPGVEGNTVFQLIQKPVSLPKRLYNLFKSGVGYFYTTEVLHYQVYIRVKTTNPNCPYNFKKDSLFPLNSGDGKEICPAAFNNIFPIMLPQIYNASCNSSFSTSSYDTGLLACPDHRTNILFKLQQNNDNGWGAHFLEPACCKPLDDVAIKVKTVPGICSKGYKVGERFLVKDILEGIGVPCLTILHTAYPYVYALMHGGKLGFYSNNYESAIVQCPNTDVKVEIKLELAARDKISIQVLNSKTTCPLGLTKGLNLSLYPGKSNYFCMPSLMSMYPYIINNGLLSGHIFHCPNNKGKVCFMLDRVQ